MNDADTRVVSLVTHCTTRMPSHRFLSTSELSLCTPTPPSLPGSCLNSPLRRRSESRRGSRCTTRLPLRSGLLATWDYSVTGCMQYDPRSQLLGSPGPSTTQRTGPTPAHTQFSRLHATPPLLTLAHAPRRSTCAVTVALFHEALCAPTPYHRIGPTCVFSHIEFPRRFRGGGKRRVWMQVGWFR
jgi:hypothetical protein